LQRYDFFYAQLVEEGHLDDAFAGAELADQAIVSDFGLVGITSGLSVSEHAGVPDLTVDVTAGAAYDQLGQRMRVASTQSPSLANDSSAVSTAVTAPGNEKWIGLFIKFARVLTDPQLDGNLSTVFFNRAESFSFFVVQGAEAPAGTATRPALIGDGILLADVLRTFGDTQIFNAAISTTRRESAFKLSAGALSVVAGGPEASDQALLSLIEANTTGLAAHLADTTDAHLATAIGTTITTTWFDSSGITGTNVDAALEEIIADLAATAGAARIGTAAHTSSSGGQNLAAASIQAQLNELSDGAVATTNNQTIAGQKTFSGQIRVSGSEPHILNATSGGDVVIQCSNGAGTPTFAVDLSPGGSSLQRCITVTEPIGTHGFPGFDTQAILLEPVDESSSVGHNVVIAGGESTNATGSTSGSIQFLLNKYNASATTPQGGLFEVCWDRPDDALARRVRYIPFQTTSCDGAEAIAFGNNNTSMDLPEDSCAQLRVVVLFMEEGADLYGSVELRGTFRRATGGSAAQVGTTTTVHTAEELAGSPTVTLGVSSNRPTITITGGTNDMVAWGFVEMTTFARPTTIENDQSS
jgi:hypothetical protein